MTAERIDPAALLRHRAFVRAVAYRLLKDPHLVDDVEQETWITAMERPPKDRGALAAWLGQVARRLSLRTLRDRSRRRVRERKAPNPSRPPSPDDLADTLAWQQRVVAAVLALPPDARAVILLRFYEDLPPREAARRLGIPVNTVRTRTRRAVEQLRRRLDDRDGRASWTAGLLPLLHRPVATGGGVLTGVVLMGTKIKLAAAVALVALVAWPFLSPGDRDARRAEAASRTPQTSPSVPPAAESCVVVGRFVNATGRVSGGVTDGDAFVVEAGKPFRLERVEPGPAELAVRDEAGARAKRVFRFAPGTTDLGSIVLAKSVTATGVVLAPDESPAAGAIVEAWGAPEMLRHLLTWDDPLLGLRAAQSPGAFAGSARTDAAGRFVLPLPSGADLVVRARRGDEISRALTRLDFARDTGTVVLRLRTGARASGQVVDSSGNPVAGAVVQLFAPPRTMTYRFEGPGLAAAVRARPVTTDADGRFELPAAAPGHYAVAVRHPRYMPVWRTGVPVPTARLRFRLFAGVPVAGRVTVAGEPAPGTTLRLVPRDGSLLAQEAVAGSDGAFRFPRAPRAFHLFAQGPHGTGLRQNVVVRGDEPVAIELCPGREVRGRVVDPDGTPVAGYRVQAWEFKVHTPRAAFTRGYQETTTDDQGRFTFQGASSRLPVFLNGRGNRGWGSVHENVAPGAQDVELRVRPRQSLPGRVIDEQGEPVAGAELYAVFSGRGRDDPSQAAHRVFSDAAGRFVVPGLDTEYSGKSIAARKAGYAPARSTYIQHDTESVEIVLRRGRSVKGVVRDENGAPIESAYVALLVERRPILETFTDAGGRYAFACDGDAFELDVSRPGFVSGLFKTADVVLIRGVRREGRVVAEGKPPEPVEAARIQAGRQVVFSAGDGTFALEDVRPGVRATISAPGFALRQVVLDRESATIEVQPGHRIEGRVLDADGKPAAGRVVFATGNKLSRGAGVNSDGSFRIEGLREGRYTVTVASPGYASRRDVVTGSTGLEFRPVASGTFTGVVFDGAGRAVSGATVRLHDGGPSPMVLGHQETDATGRFVFGNVRASVFVVYVERPGYAYRPLRVEGARADVRVPFVAGRTIAGRIEGELPDGLRVYVDGPKCEGVAKVAEDGTFSITGLVPGRYRVYALSVPGLRAEVKGVEAGAEDVVLKLKR